MSRVSQGLAASLERFWTTLQQSADLDSAITAGLGVLGLSQGRYLRLTRMGEPVIPTGVFGPHDLAWMDIYRERRYWRVDPVVRMAYRANGAFRLSEAEPLAVGDLARELGLARRARGIGNTIVSPVAGPLGERGILLFTDEESGDLNAQDRALLQGLAQMMVAAWRSLDAASPETLQGLSPREHECVCWAALGKSAASTADILGISVHTVRQHLSQGRRKLGAATHEQMILRANALGLLNDPAIAMPFPV